MLRAPRRRIVVSAVGFPVRADSIRSHTRGPVPDGDQPRLVAAGIPVFSPHDAPSSHLAHALAGIPWVRIGEHVGQRDLAVTANTYTHMLIDETELDYASLLSARAV
jgi:integrase